MTISDRPRRAYAYSRVSKVGERGSDLISPELQNHSIDSYAARNNIVIVEHIKDLDETGRDFEKRKVKNMIAGIERGEADMVLLWKWSRWGRNLLQSRIYIAAVEKAGGQVRAAEEDFDPTTTMGKFTRDQMLMIAELQSNQISDGWKDTHARRRRSGLPHTSAMRFGYAYTKGQGYSIDPATAPLVKEAYERFLAGASMRSIALDWNERGLRTTQGNRWNPTALGRMLDTGFAAGLIRERSEPPSAATNRRTIASFDIWREGAHEPIISREQWDAYRARREANALKAPRHKTVTHALSGLVVCGECENITRLISVRPSQSRHYWRCKRVVEERAHAPVNISNGRLERIVLDWIAEQAKGGGDVNERSQAQLAAMKATTSNLAELDREQSRLVAKRQRLADAMTDGIIEREDYLEQKQAIADDLAFVERALVKARDESTAAPLSPQQCAGLLSAWDQLTVEEKNSALSKVIRQIDVHPGPMCPDKVQIVPRWAPQA